jgi:hypothetical protein
VRRELEQHRRRCRRILRVLADADGPADAFSIGREIWSETIVREQPLLVVWEVLGHLDLLRSVGIVDELSAGDGRWRYALARPREAANAPHREVAAHAG